LLVTIFSFSNFTSIAFAYLTSFPHRYDTYGTKYESEQQTAEVHLTRFNLKFY